MRAHALKNHQFSMDFAYIHSFAQPKSSKMDNLRKNMDFLGTRYQNDPIKGTKCHTSQVIGCFLPRAVSKYFLTGLNGHTVVSKKV